MSRKQLVGASLAAVLFLFVGRTAFADPYPISARYLTASELPPPDQPWTHSTGNEFCGQLFSGNYGTGFIFSNAEIRVSYGGVCNALWPRPANNLASHIQIFVGYSLTGSFSNLNSANTAVVQTLIPRASPATTYLFQADIFNGTRWINLGRCVGANCG